MKINEVPQDEAYMIKGKIRDVCYAVDKDGHYTSTLSMGWTPKNEAIRLAWEEIYEQVEETRQQVLSGALSPIAFYMKLNIMDITILASYTGIPKWKVKRHLKMKHFKKLKPDLLAKYADTLNITPAELVNVERIRGISFKHED
jgi:hypothetical protein